MNNKSLCFGTLALGPGYRALARMLSIDLEIFAPGTEFIVLTDRPEDFRAHKNVQAVRFRQEALRKPYHDKRFVMREALSRHDACVFLDADMRVVGPVPDDLYDRLSPGITRYTGRPWEEWASMHNEPRFEREKRLVREAADILGIRLAECVFVWEMAWALKHEGEKHHAFLDAWDKLAHHFQLKRLHHGEGHSIGIAAHMAGLTMTQDRSLGDHLFKDLWVINSHKRGEDVPQHLQICHRQRQLVASFSDKPVESLVNKVRSKVREHFYRFFPSSKWVTLKKGNAR